VLLAIGTGADLDDPKRFRFEGTESYVKSEEEMARLFPGRPDVLENTQKVADLCEFDFEKRYFVPSFPRPEGFESDEALLRHLAEEGAVRRYGTPLPDAVRERLDFELGVINTAGYAGYFLIVADFISAARDRGIPVGPGAAAPPAPSWRTRWASRRLPAQVRPAVRALPQPRAACRCPTSTSTSASSAGAR